MCYYPTQWSKRDIVYQNVPMRSPDHRNKNNHGWQFTRNTVEDIEHLGSILTQKCLQDDSRERFLPAHPLLHWNRWLSSQKYSSNDMHAFITEVTSITSFCLPLSYIELTKEYTLSIHYSQLGYVAWFSIMFGQNSFCVKMMKSYCDFIIIDNWYWNHCGYASLGNAFIPLI